MLLEDGPLEQTIENYPWQKDVEVFENYTVYRDGFPVTCGHMLFVPIEAKSEYVIECFAAAFHMGYRMKRMGFINGFNVGMNYGKAAGQTKAWPHVHLIPRYDGDCEDPTGGVRNVIPGKGKYE